jgi:hypothetical protein
MSETLRVRPAHQRKTNFYRIPTRLEHICFLRTSAVSCLLAALYGRTKPIERSQQCPISVLTKVANNVIALAGSAGLIYRSSFSDIFVI